MKKTDKFNSILKGALFAGMFIVVIFAFIGLSKIVPKAITSLGSAFSGISSSLFGSNEKIVISTTSNSVKSGESIDIYFEHSNKSTEGNYEFKFDCGGKNLNLLLVDGNNQINIPCNATTTLFLNPFKIVPQLKDQNSFVDSNLYISFRNSSDNKITAIGKTILTVRNGDVQNTISENRASTTPTISATKKPAVTQNTSNYYVPSGKADLRILAKDTGTVVNGVFIQKNIFATYEASAVRFDISNIGGTPTGPWQFTAVLPTYPSQVFPSGIQPSLKPGETIEYTLSMQNLASIGNNVVSVNVDTNQVVSELSETNNGIVMTITNSGYSTGLILPPYYNNYNYGNTSNSDLMLRIIKRGYMDRNNGRFYEANSVSERDRVAIRFEIENIGRGETGPFIYTADLSGYYNDQYVSPVQTTFYPGEKRQYTVDFDSDVADIGTNTITIRVDTNNSVNETREDNNALSQDILVY